jgi:hypothetical protein
MARIRTIKPAFFRDLGVAALPIPTRLTYIGLWTYVDDAGRGVDDARLIKAELWPLDDKYTLRKVSNDLEMLAAFGRICRYQGQPAALLLHIVHWDHQKINHPQPSRMPPCTFPGHSRNIPGTIPPEGKGRDMERKGTGEGGNGRPAAQGRPPFPGREPAGPAQTAAAALAIMARNGKPPCPACDGTRFVEAHGTATPCPTCAGDGIES